MVYQAIYNTDIFADANEDPKGTTNLSIQGDSPIQGYIEIDSNSS